MNKEKLDDNKYRSASLFLSMEDLNDQIKNHTKFDLLGPANEHFETLERFDAYPLEIRRKAYLDFQIFSEILSSALKSLDDKFNDRKVLWSVLKKLNSSFEDDLFETIGPNDIVEIYRNDNIQVYRNFRFHELCDYKLPELFTIPWDQLFYREPYFTKQMMNTCISIFQSKEKGKISLDFIKPHELTELMSSNNNNKWRMKLKFAFPLFTDMDYPEYVLSISEVTKEKSVSKNFKELIH